MSGWGQMGSHNLDNTAFSLLQASANPQKLPGALLAGGPPPSLETGHADLDRGAFSAVLGLGNDSTLAQIQRSVQMASGAEPADISSLLAASIGVPPGTGLGAPEDPGTAILSQLLPLNRPLGGRPSDLAESLPRALGEDDDAAESEEGSFEEGDGSLKRKAPVTEEDRKRRRQEINRQSARRIRERRSHELETLKQQVTSLQHQQQLLLRYAAQLAREKNALVQRTLELTERWNQAAAENLEMRARMQDLGQLASPANALPATLQSIASLPAAQRQQ